MFIASSPPEIKQEDAMKISALLALLAILFSGCHGGQLATEFGDEFREGTSEPMTVERFICEEAPPPAVEEYQCPDCLRYFPEDADAAGIVLPKRIFESELLRGSDDGGLSNALHTVKLFLSETMPFANPEKDVSSICYASKYPPPSKSLTSGPNPNWTNTGDMDPESIIARSENFGIIFKGVLPAGFSMKDFLVSTWKWDDDTSSPCQCDNVSDVNIGDKCTSDEKCIATAYKDDAVEWTRLLADQDGAFFVDVSGNKVLLMGQLGKDAIFLGTRGYWKHAKGLSSPLANKCPQKDMMKELPTDASFRHAKVFTEQSMDPISASILEKVHPIFQGELIGSRAAVAADLYDKILLMAKLYIRDEEPAIDAFFRLSLKDLAPMSAVIMGIDKVYQVIEGDAAQDATDSLLSE